MSAADVFLRREGFLRETMPVHSLAISFKKSLSMFTCKGLTLQAALAISFLVPCRRDLPNGSRSVLSFRCLCWDGHVTITLRIH